MYRSVPTAWLRVNESVCAFSEKNSGNGAPAGRAPICSQLPRVHLVHRSIVRLQPPYRPPNSFVSNHTAPCSLAMSSHSSTRSTRAFSRAHCRPRSTRVCLSCPRTRTTRTTSTLATSRHGSRWLFHAAAAGGSVRLLHRAGSWRVLPRRPASLTLHANQSHTSGERLSRHCAVLCVPDCCSGEMHRYSKATSRGAPAFAVWQG